MMPDHNVDTVITLSSPLLGQFGSKSCFSFFCPLFYSQLSGIWQILPIGKIMHETQSGN